MNPSTDRKGLPGQALRLDSPAGPLALRMSGSGAPLLLVHSINAAPSMAEVAPIHHHFEGTRCVFSLDLPGFGASDRSDRAYTPRLMTDALHAATQEIRRRCGPAPIDALALSLSCEFLARAAIEQPSHFRSLGLVSPTGFNGRGDKRGPAGSTMAIPWLMHLLRASGAWPALFRTLTRPSVIRYFLRKTFGSSEIDDELFEQAVQQARVAGAMHAPLYFLTGALFSRDIHTLYDDLRCPVWMCHGVRGDFTDYRQKSRLQGKANWHFSVMQTGALPHFEKPDEFFHQYSQFLCASANLSR